MHFDLIISHIIDHLPEHELRTSRNRVKIDRDRVTVDLNPVAAKLTIQKV